MNEERNSEHERRRMPLGRRLLYGALGGAGLFAAGATLLWLGALDAILPATSTVDDRAAELREASRLARERYRAETAARSDDPTREAAGQPLGEEGYFVPPAMDEVPDGPFGASVKRGREIFINTDTNAGAFVGNGLACANCHLDDGREPNAAPMWAASVLYPTFRGKNEMINTMEDRINGCFTFSMNAQGSPSGSPPPADHQVFKDLQSYFYFLGTGAPLNQMMPGQGYPKVPEPASGHDWRRGEDVYAANCAVCHGEDGEGRRDLNGRTIFPPLWGPRSFNWGAGMHRVNTAAAFIQANMPFGAADSLSDQEAWDVAAYVMSHERPPDPRQLEEDLSVAEAHDRYHAHPGFYGQTVRGEFLDGVPNTTEDELTGREEASTPAETRGAVGKAGGG